MRKAFYIVLDTNQSDTQCRLEFENAVGNLTQARPEIIKVNPQFSKEELEAIMERNEPKTAN